MPVRPRWNRLLLLASFLLPPGCAFAVEPTADTLQTLPDFKVEVVLKAGKAKNGSWIGMAKDDKGRLLLGGQQRQPVTRVTIEDGKVAKEEVLKLPISECMGMLQVGDALYIDGFGKAPNGKNVFGLFRLRNPQDDGTYQSVELLREWVGGSGEHGAHNILLGPDKKLYIICGNFVQLPKDLLPSSPHRNYADDLVLPRAEDGNGFGAGKKPPGGFVCRMDLDGQNPELFASGERNTYDIAFNADGELLGFDSDMEWDWGTPWYRPIRVYHATSGADQGFREGSAKWPEYYEDSLPAAVNIGIGCPTGVAFGAGAKFPAKYQKAFYVLDWSYGRLIAVHLKPNGSSYTGTWENFVAPKSLHSTSNKVPLNLTDVVIGNDGAMYFTTGGRNTQAYLYRVTYTGNESTAPADLHDADGAEARATRHKLEAFHGHTDPTAVATAWPYLDSSDRFLRYAARIAIESQPVEEWKSRALSEKQPQAALEGLLALARLGGRESQGQVLGNLAKMSISSLTPEQQLEKLRVIEVAIARDGKPSNELADAIIAELDPLLPAKTLEMNRELSRILLALEAPDAVAKTMALLERATTQEEQLGYVLDLRTIKTGWTLPLRQKYLSWWDQKHPGHPESVATWFKDAGIAVNNGASFSGFLDNFHADVERALSADEKSALQPMLATWVPFKKRRNRPPVRPHVFVKEWKFADLEGSLPEIGHGRNFERGQQAYEAAQCASCHKFGDSGGAVGPDLTAVSSRFQRKDILESILDPSKVVSEQYMNTSVKLKNGDIEVGRVLEENDDHLVLMTNPLQPDEKVEVKKSKIVSRKLSPISPMPEGVVNVLSKDELLDLVAYLESGGHKDHPDFKP